MISFNDIYLRWLIRREARRRLKDHGEEGVVITTDPNKHSDTILVVVRASEWKISGEMVNAHWDSESSKSYQRDLYCHQCKEQIVMSNHLFENYSKNPRPEFIRCATCVF